MPRCPVGPAGNRRLGSGAVCARRPGVGRQPGLPGRAQQVQGAADPEARRGGAELACVQVTVGSAKVGRLRAFTPAEDRKGRGGRPGHPGFPVLPRAPPASHPTIPAPRAPERRPYGAWTMSGAKGVSQTQRHRQRFREPRPSHLDPPPPGPARPKATRAHLGRAEAPPGTRARPLPAAPRGCRRCGRGSGGSRRAAPAPCRPPARPDGRSLLPPPACGPVLL